MRIEPNQQITENFNCKEFWDSPTARRKGIDNHIPEELHQNLYNLVQMLQVVRNHYGKPIIVSSGYRSPKLNKVVGGVKTSQHMQAAAADIKTVSDTSADNKKLFDLIVTLAKEGKIVTRQIIDEYNYNWIHISVNDDKHQFRKNQLVHIK